MCFSAQASFVAGAALISCSYFTTAAARRAGRRYLALAALPLFFGIQQLSEGFLWLSLDGAAGWPLPPELIFLFFAYWFWPFWVPLSSALIETDAARAKLFSWLSVAGFVLGLVLFLPMLFDPDSLHIVQMHHSIRYEYDGLFSGEVFQTAIRIVYAAIIVVPLIGSSHRQVQIFGCLIAVSVAVGFLFASYAFTSIWCFLAAVLSGYVLWVLHRLPASADCTNRTMAPANQVQTATKKQVHPRSGTR